MGSIGMMCINLHVINFRKRWHPLRSLNPFLIMLLKWLLLTILYLSRVMYLYPLILETWQGLLKVIAVFLDVVDQYLRIGKLLFTQGAHIYLSFKICLITFF